MTTDPVGHRSAGDDVDRVRRILDLCGVSFAGAHRAASASHDVWLVSAFCLRVGPTYAPWAEREASLAELLPASVGYPEVLAVGRMDDRDWMLQRRLPGGDLWRTWASLSPAERTQVIGELWSCHLALHTVDVSRIRLLPPRQRGSHADLHTDVAASRAALAALAAAGTIEGADADVIEEYLATSEPALASVDEALVHGDASPNNAMCDGGRVLGLIDFESADVHPVDIDLHKLLSLFARRVADPPPAGVNHFGGHDAPHFGPAFWELAELARPVLRQPDARERMRLYSVVGMLSGQALALERKAVGFEVLRRWGLDVVRAVAGHHWIDVIHA